nr:putative protease Do-like 14 [Ziziphus jujuba var. spinosa]
MGKGSSWGPLVNIDGEVVGVNIMKEQAAADYLSFIVPSDSCHQNYRALQEKRVVRVWLGLKMVDLNEMFITQLKERNATFPNLRKIFLLL